MRSLFILGWCLFLVFSWASFNSRAQEIAQSPGATSTDDLSHRLVAAMEARNSGDPGVVSQASRRVIALALAQMAKLRLDKREYEESIKLCTDSLEFEDTAETRVEIAIADFYVKKLPEALKQASSAAELDPQNALAWTIKGEALLRSKDYAEAATALGRAIELNNNAEALYAFGVAQLGLGNKEAAAKSFAQFLAVVGDFGWSRLLLGRAYQGQVLLSEAEAEFRTAVTLDPHMPNAHYFWALNLLKQNEWRPAAGVYEQLQDELRLNPRHFEANYMLGFLASNARNYTASDQYLLLAAAANPSVPETWVLLGLNARNRQANQDAEKFFRKAIQLAKALDPNEHLEVRKAYFGLGRLLVLSGKTAEGQELLNKARELQMQSLVESQKAFAAEKGQGEGETVGTAIPDLPESDSLRGDPLFSSTANGLKAKESSSSRPGTARSPSDPQGKSESHLEAVLGSSFNDLATAEALQEKYDLAWKHYHHAARWDSHIPGLQRNLGLAAYFAGQPAEAIRLLSKVVVQTPADAHARAVLGLAYFATQNFAAAARTIVPIENQALEDPLLGFAWAKSLAETGNKQGATRALVGLEKANPNPGVDTLIQFGKLWLQLGEENRASQAFHRALLLDPENPDAQCALHLTECHH